jgi:hypothetical protein
VGDDTFGGGNAHADVPMIEGIAGDGSAGKDGIDSAHDASGPRNPRDLQACVN